MLNLDGLFIVSLIGTCVQAVNEARQPEIPAENWNNKELYHEDLMSGISGEQLMKNVKNWKYKLTENYQEPHKGKDGKIIIENTLLYKEDLEKYGAYQTYKWVKQGRYNLTPEELKKEDERLDAYFKELYSLL